MSYSGSQAFSGASTVFAINTGTSGSPTWTQIAEILDCTNSGSSNKVADVTNLSSTGFTEFLPVLSESGVFDLQFNRVASDVGQTAVKASFDARTIVKYKITLPMAPGQSVSGDTFQFSALVEELDHLSNLSPNKQVVTKCKLKISGAITFTAGS